MNIQEIRAAIDELDQEIVALIGKRYRYVKAAAKFKTSKSSVKAPDRVKAMLQKRRTWAESAGLNPDVIERLYTDLVDYFIREEMQQWEKGV